MQFVVANRHIKQFSKSLQCISRIGDDLYIEPRYDSIKFTTVNNSKSTFVVFQFQSSFFHTFQLESEEGIQYKTKSKLCFQMFHSLSNIDKCAMKIEAEGKISFYLLCKNGIQKTYSINYELAQCQSALYNKDSPYKISVKPKQISDCLNYFSGSTEEISILVQKDRFLIKSSTDDKKGLKTLYTELILDRSDFDDYIFNGDNGTEISFSFKDLKTIMAYVDVIGNPCTFFIDRSGLPFHINLKYSSTFEVDFVLATLFDAAAQTASQQGSQQQQQDQQYQDQQYQQQQYQHQQQYRNSNNVTNIVNSSPLSMNVRSGNTQNQQYQQQQQQQQQQQYQQQNRNISTIGSPNVAQMHQNQQQYYNSPNSVSINMNNMNMFDDESMVMDMGPSDHDLNPPSPNTRPIMNNTNRTSQQHQQHQPQPQIQTSALTYPSSNQSNSSHITTHSKKPVISYRNLNLEADDDEEEEQETFNQNENEHIQTSQNI